MSTQPIGTSTSSGHLPTISETNSSTPSATNVNDPMDFDEDYMTIYRRDHPRPPRPPSKVEARYRSSISSASRALNRTMDEISRGNEAIARQLLNESARLGLQSDRVHRALLEYTMIMRYSLENPSLCVRICWGIERVFNYTCGLCRRVWNYFFA